MKVKVNTMSRAHGSMGRSVKGQAMTEFIFMSFVAFIILFVAIQMAALGREYMALGQLNYQVARWATDPGNNSLKDSSGNAVNSPQCSDIANIIAGASVSPYAGVSAVASGYMGKIGYNNTVCGTPHLRRLVPENGASEAEAETAERLVRSLMERYSIGREDLRPVASRSAE
jgi:hypothetical protein